MLFIRCHTVTSKAKVADVAPRFGFVPTNTGLTVI